MSLGLFIGAFRTGSIIDRRSLNTLTGVEEMSFAAEMTEMLIILPRVDEFGAMQR